MSIRATIRDISTYHHLLSGKKVKTAFASASVYDEELIVQAKKLHAGVYLDRGFISPDHVDAEGIMKIGHDPHQNHSIYFVVSENSEIGHPIIATARQIAATNELGFDSFPILEQARLFPKEKQRIKRGLPQDYVEISGLAKAYGVSSMAPLFLYRAMWHYSLKTEQKYWLMACDVRLYKRLKLLFGPSIRQIGDVTPYMGGDVIPAILDVPSSLAVLSNAMPIVNPINRRIRRAILLFFLEGVESKHTLAIDLDNVLSR